MCSPSKLKNVAIAKEGQNGKKKKGMEERGRKNRMRTDLYDPVFTLQIALSLTWIIAVFSCLLPKIYSPLHSSLNYHLKMDIN